MIVFHRLFKGLIAAGLVVFLAAAVTLSFLPGESWAVSLLTPSLNQPHASVAFLNQAKATAKQLEGKAQEGLGNMTGDLNTQAAGQAKQFDANTQEAMLESIDNPDYQPKGQGFSERNLGGVKELTQDVKDDFNQIQGPD